MLNALVTVQVSDLEALWPKVSARITKEPGMNVEYSCMTTGILVLRMQGLTVAEKSDVMAIVKRIMREAGVKGAIEFLDVHVEPGDGNRCMVPGMLPTAAVSASCYALRSGIATGPYRGSGSRTTQIIPHLGQVRPRSS